MSPRDARLARRAARQRVTVDAWKADLKSLLAPTSVAIVGASDAEGTWGKRIFDNLQRTGYRGSVYAVNDVNPLFVRAAGAGVRVADALVVLGS